MKNLLSLVLVLLVTPKVWAVSTDVVEESVYQMFKQSIASEKKIKFGELGITDFENSLYMDALWDLVEEEGDMHAHQVLKAIRPFHWGLMERLRLEILRLKYQYSMKLPDALVEELVNVLRMPSAETKLIYTLAAYEEDLLEAGHHEIIELAKNHPQYDDIVKDEEKKKELSTNVVADLFYHSPDLRTYMNGEYAQSVKIFMFCRSNRLYPCLMTMRDIDRDVVRNEDGTLWTHPALASSARGLPSYVRNGNTPAGVWTIDSVMPYADQQVSFGKFRRMIINFIPKSTNEARIKSLLPASSHNEDWWKPSVAARDIGRNLFRIHGTGKINKDPSTPYFPFMRTSGCIAQRENTYSGVTYKDQRELLDDIMVAMQLDPLYANETKVKGVLYLMELDDQMAPVTVDDLLVRGIE